MSTANLANLRAATIAALIKRAPKGVGRTALMKMVFFLQTVRDAPLEYSFRLYTYGPYDPQVLDDLKLLEAHGGVSIHAFDWEWGSGYEMKPGKNADRLIERARGTLVDLDQHIDWVISEFGNSNAIELEVASTALYVDRSSSTRGERLSIEELVARVHEIKPHRNFRKIESEIRDLKRRGLLNSAA